jgi:hypothetical protein
MYLKASLHPKFLTKMGKKKRKKDRVDACKKFTYPQAGTAVDDPIGSVFGNQDVLAKMFDYVPARDKLLSCSFVSRTFHATISEKVPLKLRIEDRGDKQLWFFRPSWNLSRDGQSDRDEVLYPFYKIDSIPSSIRMRVTELTLVMRMVPEHAEKYDLASMVDILKDFRNLEYLRIMSELGIGDCFCDLFIGKVNYFLRLRTLWISGYKLDWRIKSLVMAAPNLEHLEISSRARGCDLIDLLPLAGSLRALRIRTGSWRRPVHDADRKCMGGNVDDFLVRMPSLQSWDFSIGEYFTFRNRSANACHNTEALSAEDSQTYGQGWLFLGNDFQIWLAMNIAETRAVVLFTERFVNWFLKLEKKEKRHKSISRLIRVAEWNGLLQRTTKRAICWENIGDKKVQADVLAGLEKFKHEYMINKAYNTPGGLLIHCDRLAIRYWRYLDRRSRRLIYRKQKYSKYVPFETSRSHICQKARQGDQWAKLFCSIIYKELYFSLFQEPWEEFFVLPV